MISRNRQYSIMKFNNYFFLSFVFALAGILPVKADTTLPPKVKVFCPEVLLSRTINQHDTDDLIKSDNWGQNGTPGERKHWVVYSDRDNNTTYSSPAEGTPFSKLEFNERVIIANIKDGFALVYSDPIHQAWPNHSKRAVSKGWVPMSNLLLWQSCPVNAKGNYQKVVFAADLESGVNINLGYSYINPIDKTVRNPIRTDLTPYYVMKTDPASGLKLLARQTHLDSNTEKVLYGWVDDNSFVNFSGRVFLEPNWEPDEVAYFNSPAGKQYPIYPDMEMKQTPASYYQYGIENTDDKRLSTRYRLNRYLTRFPILELDDSLAGANIYKFVTFGYAARPDICYKGNRKHNEMSINELDKIKHINIIFVIDGTKSMKPYFTSVKEAINRSISIFDPIKFTLRVGSVIYRDYTDGEYVIEKVPLVKPNSPQLLNFLDTAGKYGANSSMKDMTNTEALYKGLEEATDPQDMGFTQDESTIIVVVGDCGNDEADTRCLSTDQLVDRLEKNNIQLMSFQVDNRPSHAWELFNDQMCELISKNLMAQYKRINTSPDIDLKFAFKTVNNGLDFTSNTNNDIFIGSVRFPETAGHINPSELTRLIEDNISRFAETTRSRIEALTDYDNFSHDEPEELKIQEAFLIDRIGKDLYDSLRRSGSTIAFVGYTPKKDPLGHDYWKKVVLFSSEEFETLMNRLGNLYNNSRAEGDRKPYIDAVKALIRVIAPDITEQEMDQMGISEVMRLAAGLNESSDAVKGRSLTEIQDARIVPNDEYQTLINSFVLKYENLLKNVKNKNYTYSYQSPNGQKFYWIPVDDLP